MGPYSLNVTKEHGNKTTKKVVWGGGFTPGSRVKGGGKVGSKMYTNEKLAFSVPNKF